MRTQENNKEQKEIKITLSCLLTPGMPFDSTASILQLNKYALWVNVEVRQIRNKESGDPGLISSSGR